MKRVTTAMFRAMIAGGYIQYKSSSSLYSDYTKTMKKHSKANRHQYFVREDKLKEYLSDIKAGVTTKER